MAALRSLVGKELRQHGGSLVALSLLLALSWLLGYASFQREARTLTPLELVAGFAGWPLGAAALFLGHRLVVMELYGRTQRFVEALPIRRGLMAGCKFGFGLACLELWAAVALGAGVLLARATQPLDGRALLVTGTRLGVYVLALWGVVFALGFFGRLRVPLGAALALALVLLDRHTAFQLERFGPFALIARETFGLERSALPWRALLEAAAIGGAGLLVGLCLARVRDGSIAETLARPLGAREVSALCIVVAGVAVAVSAVEAEAPPQPFAFTTAAVVRQSEPRLEIGYLEDDLRPTAESLSRALGPLLTAFHQALGWPEPLPAVHIVHAPELRPERPRTASRHWERGLVLRANLRALDERTTTLLFTHTLHELIWARTHGRAGLEPRHWALDGFALHFALQGRAPATASAPIDGAAADDPWLRRALAAAERAPLSPAVLEAYYSTAERLGDELCQALAASGWRTLEALTSRERALALARAAFARRGTGDLRDFLHDRRHPWPALFEEATGLPLDRFITAWGEALARRRSAPGNATLLAGLPRAEVNVQTEGVPLTVAGALTPAPPAGTMCNVIHQRLRPYETPIDPDALEEARFVWSEATGSFARPLEAGYGRGERLFVAFDCELPALGGSAFRLHDQRLTVP